MKRLALLLSLLPLLLFAEEKPSPTLLLQLRKGEVVPFSLNIKSTLFEASSADPFFCLKCQEDMWLKLEDGTPYFSTDGVIWKDWESAFQGKVAVSVQMKSDTPAGSVEIDLQEKQEIH